VNSAVVIVGGGISGLSAAYDLSKAGIAATIVERRARLGGVIQTEYLHGCTLESGPDSYLGIKPAAGELIREVGLGGDIIGSNDHLRVTYIWRGGRLVPLPDGLMMMVPTRLAPMVASPLLGWGTKIKMGLEVFRKPARRAPGDRSVAEFITDHYGRESLDYLAEPLLSGVYGGDPGRLSASSVLTRFVELENKYGSLTKGVLAERAKAAAHGGRSPGPLFNTLKGGLATLVGEIESCISGSTTVIHGEAEALEPGRIRVNGEWVAASEVILACPAYEAAALVRSIDPALAGLLGQVDYSSSLTLSLGYDQATFGRELKGFGFLVPAKERRRLVACTWVQNKFSHRVPCDKIVLRCFFGGAGDAEVLGETDESIVAIAKDEILRILGVSAEPTFYSIARWPRSMAQYTVGHQQRLKEIETRAAAQPGLYLAGNAYYGIGIPDCIKTGREAARKIAALHSRAAPPATRTTTGE
jgi:oxygen-dependent protoporphyrinogen oxidase